MQLGSGKGQALIGKRAVVALANAGIAAAIPDIVAGRRYAVVGRTCHTADVRQIVAIHAHDNGRVIIRRQPQIQRGLGPVGRRGWQIESDRRRRGVVISLAVGDHRLDEIPVRAPAAGANDIVWPARKIERILQPLAPDRARCRGAGTDIAHPVIIAMAKLLARAIGITDFKYRGPHPRRCPGDRAQIVGAHIRDRNAERRGWHIIEQGRAPAGLGLRHECSRRTGSKRVQCIVGACNHIWNRKIPIRIRLHPELVRLGPLLEIVGTRAGQRLLHHTHPQAAGGGVRIAAVADHQFAGDRAPVGGRGVIGVVKPSIRPRTLLRHLLRQRITIERLRGLRHGGETVGDVVAVNEIGPVNLRPYFTGANGIIAAQTIIAAREHVQNRCADVLHQIPFHGTAGIAFHAGGNVPDAHVLSAGPHAAPAPHPLRAEVRRVFVFILVLPGVDAIGPKIILHRRTPHHH